MNTMGRMVIAAMMAVGVARAGDACRADVDKLCAGVPPGGGRILACLKANQAQVSPACKQELKAVAEKAKQVGAACEGDVQQFCAGVKKGGGAILRCLASNAASLSPPCAEVVEKAREKLAEFKQACGADAGRFCQGIPPGQGRILACLKSRQAELSPPCQAMMAR